MNVESTTASDRLEPEKRAVIDLPPSVSPFIREKLLREVTAALLDPDIAVTTIAGQGGMGKTVLAAETVRRLIEKNSFGSGVVWLTCRKYRDSSDLLKAAESRLLAAPSGSSDQVPPAGSSVLERVLALLRSRRALVVLDGLGEMSDNRDLIGFVARIGGSGKVLLTAREPLRLFGHERVFELKGLSQAEARKLIDPLTNQGKAASEEAAERIGRVAEGRPWVIEILSRAGLRADEMEEAAASLERAEAFGGDQADWVSVREALDAAYRRLGENTKRLLRTLSVFKGSFEDDAIADIFQDDGWRSGLEELLRLGLIFAEGDSYGLHDVVREFANQKLVAAGEYAGVRRRTASYFATLARRDFQKLGTNEAPEAMRTVETYLGDFQASVDWLFEERRWEDTISLGMALGELFVHAGALDLSVRTLNRALEAAEVVGDRGQVAAILHNLGTAYQYQGDYGRARSMFEEGLRINQELGDRRSTAANLHQLGVLARSAGRYEEAESLYRESLRIDEETGDLAGVGADLYELGALSYSRGAYSEAADGYTKSREIYEGLADWVHAAQASQFLGRVRLAEARYDEARQQFERALEVFTRAGNRSGESAVLADIGLVHSYTGHPAEALVNYEQALAIARRFSPAVYVLNLLKEIGTALARAGQTDKAAEYLKEARALALRAADRDALVQILTTLGVLKLRGNNIDKASEFLREALTEARLTDQPSAILPVLVHLARAAQLRSDLGLARNYLEEALDVTRQGGDPKQILGIIQNLATVEFEGGELQAAQEHAQEALSLARNLGDEDLEGFVAILGSKIAARKGDYGSAFRLARKALDALRPFSEGEAAFVPSRFSLSGIYNFGELSDHLRDLRKELGPLTFEKALKDAGVVLPSGMLEAEPGDASSQPQYFVALARGHESGGRWEPAIEAYKKALNFYESDGSESLPEEGADLKFHLGICLRNADRLREALTQQTATLEMLVQSGDLKARGDVLMEIALLHQLLNNYEEAWLRYLDAYRLYRRAEDGAGHRPGMAAASEALGTLEFYARMLPQAIRDLEDARDIYLSLGLKGKSSLVEETLNAARQAQSELEAPAAT